MWIRRCLSIALVQSVGCSSVHKLAELQNPRLEIDIFLSSTGLRTFDLVIANDGAGNDGCPKTTDDIRGFVNDVELDCAPGQVLDERVYGGLFICASPRCFLREGAIPNDDRRVPRAATTVIRAFDSSIAFELDSGDLLAGQDVVASPSGSIGVGNTMQLLWRGAVGGVLNGTLLFVDENRTSQWSQPIDVQTGTTITGPAISFTFPPTSPVRGYLQLIEMELAGQVDLCKSATRCSAILDYAATVEIPLTVTP